MKTTPSHADGAAPARRAALRLRRLLADPVVHFVVAGGLIFAIYAGFGEAPVRLDDARPVDAVAGLGLIELSAVDLAAFREEFEWLEGRAPTTAELRVLADRWVADEILFREALQSGMHRVDAKIREQLIDHMRLLHAGDLAEPADAELLDFYRRNMDRYYADRKFSFDHVFFSAAPADPDSVLGALRRDQPVAGDEFWLGSALIGYDENILRSSFGGRFVRDLLEVEPGDVWFGPVQSERGFHFVRLRERLAPAPLAFAEIRGQVFEDWRRADLEARLERFIAEKAPGYRVQLPDFLQAASPDT